MVKNYSSNSLDELCKDIEDFKGKIQPYMSAQTSRHWTKSDVCVTYNNEYISVLRVDSSNKWVGEENCGFMSKMWSIIINKKWDFSNLAGFIKLKKILDIGITPVKKGELAGNFGIRIYNMRQEPDYRIIKDILDFIFNKTEQYKSYNKTEANFSQSTKSDNNTEIKPIQRYAGVGSMVTYRILEDDEINQVTIVEPANKKSDKEVSKTSELGESLLYCKEGEVVKVNSVEPYTISILHISNPINNVRYEIQAKKSDYSLYSKQNDNYNMQANSKLNKYREHNMSNAEEQRKIFWETFEDVLMENGEPFSVCYMMNEKPQSWANVNRNHAWNANAIDLSFLNSQGLFRVDLYMQNGEQDQIGRKIKANKEDVNSMITLPVRWENGEKNPNTLRPSVYFPFEKNNKDDYRRVIEESLPTILEFIEVANIYGKNMFFDF